MIYSFLIVEKSCIIPFYSRKHDWLPSEYTPFACWTIFIFYFRTKELIKSKLVFSKTQRKSLPRSKIKPPDTIKRLVSVSTVSLQC